MVEGQRKGPIHCNGDHLNHEDWVTISLWPAMGGPRLNIVKSDDSTSTWDTLARAPTRLDFDELAVQLIPREWIINCPSIELHKNIVYGQPRINDIVPYVDVNTRSYRDVPIIMPYFDHFVNNRPDDRQRRPSLCLLSCSGLGKSDYVRRLGNHVYFDGEISCKRMNSDTRFMVSDDVPCVRFGNAGHWKQYYGCQKTFGLRDLHFKGQMIWGCPCIFLCNEDENPRLDGTLDTDYLLSNCIFVDLKESLYQNADWTLADVYVPEANVPAAPAWGIELDFLTV